MAEFTKAIKFNDRGSRVKDAQFVLVHNRFKHLFSEQEPDGIWGPQSEAAADYARWWLGYPLGECKTGQFGQKLYDFLRTDGKAKKLPEAYLARSLKRRASGTWQSVPLPKHIHFPGVSYPMPHTWGGLQPWIVPQAQAICHHFGLTLTAGYGGHPPHAYYSDHRWGGAIDIAGPLENMIRACFWGDSLCSGFYRSGAVFRWVGGPAHDRNGIEAGHYNHTHLSWFRMGPATTCLRPDGTLKGT